ISDVAEGPKPEFRLLFAAEIPASFTYGLGLGMHFQFWCWKHWCATAIALFLTLLSGEPTYSQPTPASPPSIDFAQNSAAEKGLQQLPPAVRRTLEAELRRKRKPKRSAF